MTSPSALFYPNWLRTIVVIELLAVVATGGIILYLSNALSGPLTPEQWLIWLGLPLLVTTLFVGAGYGLLTRSINSMGAVITSAPLLLLGLFLIWATI